jgi:hypothetical protein
MAFNADKSALMVVQLASDTLLMPPLMIDSVAIQQKDEIKYLGITLDRRLTMEKHWAKTAAQGKAVLGALGRLVGGDRLMTKYLYKERVESAFSYGLTAAPPNTQKGWRRITSLASYGAHLCTGNWALHGSDIIHMAGLETPAEKAALKGLQFTFKSLLKERRWGDWLVKEPPPPRELRSGSARTGLEIVVPMTPSVQLDKLAPNRHAQLWNHVVQRIPAEEMEAATRGVKSFTKIVRPIIKRLPPGLRGMHYLG